MVGKSKFKTIRGLKESMEVGEQVEKKIPQSSYERGPY